MSRCLISIRPLCPTGLARLPDLLARPLPRPFDGGQRVRRGGAGPGRSSRRSSTSKPQRRSSRIMSPWPRWNSTESSSGHSNRCMPKYGRSSRSVAGRPSSSGMVSISSTRVDQEDQLPAGTQQPRRLGDPGVRVAPDAGAVLADRQVEAGVGERRPLGVGVDQREPQPEPLLQLAGGRQLGRRSCPGRPAGRRGAPARPRRSRCRSPARWCRSPSRPGGSTPACASGMPRYPRSARPRTSSAGPAPAYRTPTRPTRRGCAAHDQPSRSQRPASAQAPSHRQPDIPPGC